MEKTKLCRDCAYYLRNAEEDEKTSTDDNRLGLIGGAVLGGILSSNKCTRKIIPFQLDIVTGDIEPSSPASCYDERYSDDKFCCGKDAKFFLEINSTDKE